MLSPPAKAGGISIRRGQRSVVVVVSSADPADGGIRQYDFEPYDGQRLYRAANGEDQRVLKAVRCLSGYQSVSSVLKRVSRIAVVVYSGGGLGSVFWPRDRAPLCSKNGLVGLHERGRVLMAAGCGWYDCPSLILGLLEPLLPGLIAPGTCI